jgi:hypothetical protein
MVDTFFVCKEVCVDGHLSDHWAVLDDFLLDAKVILSEAVINNLVDHVVEAALVGLKVVLSNALSLCPIVRVTYLGDESLTLAPIKSTCHVAALTSIVALITTENLLSSKLNGPVSLHANAILHH